MSDDRSMPSELTAGELSARAAEYRRMAGTALEARVVAALLRLAARYDMIATEAL
jgi:hypothetical protein